MNNYLHLLLPALIIIWSSYGQANNPTINANDMEEQQLPYSDFDKMHAIATADYGKCFPIDNYMLCPEKKLIRKLGMYGTATIDCMGYFPDSSLNYNQDTMIIFAGMAFFDKSDLDIDWHTVELLSYSDCSFDFTDGHSLYHLRHGNPIYKKGEYDKNTYKFYKEEGRIKRNLDGVRELTEDFCVKENTFYFGSYVEDDFEEGGYILKPILEPFDVPNLRTIVSESGFESDYITDGKQVIFGGGKMGYSSQAKDGTNYVLAQRWMVEGIDFASLCVLGRGLLIDKNALYCGTEVIPFTELNGFRFIFREM